MSGTTGLEPNGTWREFPTGLWRHFENLDRHNICTLWTLWKWQMKQCASSLTESNWALCLIASRSQSEGNVSRPCPRLSKVFIAGRITRSKKIYSSGSHIPGRLPLVGWRSEYHDSESRIQGNHRALRATWKALEKITAVSLLPILTQAFLHMRMCLKDPCFCSAIRRKVRNFIGYFNMRWINSRVYSEKEIKTLLTSTWMGKEMYIIMLKKSFVHHVRTESCF